jgi:uncharacterized protein involved in exopolysaccharide biosynthesis
LTYESQAVRGERIDVGAVIGAIVRRLPRIILVTLLLLAATFVFLMFQPRLYESFASILVEPRNNVYLRSAGEQAPSMTGGEAGVVSSQIELIKSRDTLLKVIDQLDLRSVPEFNGAGEGGFSPFGIIGNLLGRKAAPVSIDETVLGNLYDRLSVVQERDSRLISVLVRSTDPELAARIANAVANAHVQRRAELSLSDTAEASGWLLDEIEKLRVSVNEAETAVANFKVDNDLYVGSGSSSLLDQELSTIAGQITDAQQRKNAALSRAALIRGMIDKGQPIEGIAGVGDAAAIQQLSQQKANLQSERAQRAATLLSNHPTMQALNAQIAEITNQINLEGRRVAESLEAEAQIEADLEASLQQDLARAKGTASTATQDTVTLDGLEREAAAQRTLLESYLQRYNEAASRTGSNSALPDVRVVSEAAPAVTPASPNSSLMLAAVGIVSIAVQLGLVVFGELMSGRAIVQIAEPARAQDELEAVPFDEAELDPDQRWEEEPEPVEPTVEVGSAGLASVPEADLTEGPVAVPVADLPVVEEVHVVPVAAVEDGSEPAAEDDAWEAETASEEFVESSDNQEDAVVESGRDLTPTRHSALNVLPFSDLASDLVLGRTRLLLLAAHRSSADCQSFADVLVRDALGRGLSVALVDAGSGQVGEEQGLSDLSRGEASFGDVVQKSADNAFAEVAWGLGRSIARNSTRPLTLVEALGDIYEVVVVTTGRVGVASSLPMFESLDARVVLVAAPEDDLSEVDDTREQLRAAGFERVEIATAPERAAA